MQGQANVGHVQLADGHTRTSLMSMNTDDMPNRRATLQKGALMQHVTDPALAKMIQEQTAGMAHHEEIDAGELVKIFEATAAQSKMVKDLKCTVCTMSVYTAILAVVMAAFTGLDMFYTAQSVEHAQKLRPSTSINVTYLKDPNGQLVTTANPQPVIHITKSPQREGATNYEEHAFDYATATALARDYLDGIFTKVVLSVKESYIGHRTYEVESVSETDGLRMVFVNKKGDKAFLRAQVTCMNGLKQADAESLLTDYNKSDKAALLEKLTNGHHCTIRFTDMQPKVSQDQIEADADADQITQAMINYAESSCGQGSAKTPAQCATEYANWVKNAQAGEKGLYPDYSATAAGSARRRMAETSNWKCGANVDTSVPYTVPQYASLPNSRGSGGQCQNSPQCTLGTSTPVYQSQKWWSVENTQLTLPYGYYYNFGRASSWSPVRMDVDTRMTFTMHDCNTYGYQLWFNFEFDVYDQYDRTSTNYYVMGLYRSDGDIVATQDGSYAKNIQLADGQNGHSVVVPLQKVLYNYANSATWDALSANWDAGTRATNGDNLTRYNLLRSKLEKIGANIMLRFSFNNSCCAGTKCSADDQMHMVVSVEGTLDKPQSTFKYPVATYHMPLNSDSSASPNRCTKPATSNSISKSSHDYLATQMLAPLDRRCKADGSWY